MTRTSGTAAVINGSRCAKQQQARHPRALEADYPISDPVHDLVQAATTLLDVHGAGASLAREDRLTFVTASREDVATLEQIQERDQNGPAVESFRTGRRVLVSDLAGASSLWPRLAAAGAKARVASLAAVPLRLDGHCLGALALYDVGPREWSQVEVEGAESLAALATSQLARTARIHRARITAEQLQEALDTRLIIEQAKELLAHERRISRDQAFQVLRSHARRHRAPLREVAHAIVALGLRP